MIDSTYSVSSLDGLVSSKRRLHLPPNSLREPEIEVDRLGVADVQVAVGLRRKARVHASAVLVGLQILEDDVADEIGLRRNGGFVLACSIAIFSRAIAIARSMRLRHVSRPSTSSVSNSGGASLRPHTATRIGWNIWPVLIFNSAAPARSAASSAS